MANKEEAVEEKSGPSMLMMIVIPAVIATVCSVAAQIVVPMVMPPPAAMPAGEMMEEEVSMPALYYPVRPPLIANFEHDGERHYVQATLELMAHDQAVIDHIKNHDAVLRNELLLLLGSLDYDAVLTREGKEKFQMEALMALQTLMEGLIGEVGVKGVYITSMILQ